MIDQSVTLNLDFGAARERLKGVALQTPLQYNYNLSRAYKCNVFLKREDLQVVRSYKLRGAYNMMSQLLPEHAQRGVVCASAGNHAQGFAYSCRKLGIKGIVFMPVVTPGQKLSQTRMFGEEFIEIVLKGDTFDDCLAEALKYAAEKNMVFIPPFDNEKIIEGQGTVGAEILEASSGHIDYLFVPVGGGGLASGTGMFFKTYSPGTKIIGVEPEGAPSMLEAFKNKRPVALEKIDKFVDGAAVKRAGDLTYKICSEVLSDMITVPEGKICSVILQLYNRDAIVVEPAGALSIAALDTFAEEIVGKNIVCVVSGSNNDIDRMPEIKERSLIYEGLKHYFLIRFAQRPGALKEFLNHVLGPNDDITRFEYFKKTDKENGPALIGIELKQKEDYANIINNLNKYQIKFTELNKDDTLYGYLV